MCSAEAQTLKLKDEMKQKLGGGEKRLAAAAEAELKD